MLKSIAVVLALVSAPVALAQTYIVPEAVCGAVKLNVASAGEFPQAGERIALDRVSSAFVWALPKPRVATEVTTSGQSLALSANVPCGEVVMAAVALKPTITGNETRTEHAKALIFCGRTPEHDWQRSMGLDLELYPQGWNGPRPRMTAGEPMRFIAVEKATKRLLSDVPMELHRAGGGCIAVGTAAQHGGMNFPYPEPGRYMVVATHRRRDPRDPERWLVDVSTLTFDVVEAK